MKRRPKKKLLNCRQCNFLINEGVYCQKCGRERLLAAAGSVAAVMPARFASRCPVCHDEIAVGQPISWRQGTRAIHVSCVATNSPQATDAYLASVQQGNEVRAAEDQTFLEFAERAVRHGPEPRSIAPVWRRFGKRR